MAEDAGTYVVITCGESVVIVEDGASGTDGVDGTAGVDGQDGVDGNPGTDGVDGVDGADGEDGDDGLPCTLADTEAGVAITCGDQTLEVADGKPSVTSCYKHRRKIYCDTTHN